MKFVNRILLEHLVKHLIIFGIMVVVWSDVRDGLIKSATNGNMESIAVIMGIISLCSLTGYFAFSYSLVGKTLRHRFFGYLCTFFLGLSFVLSLMTIYFIAVIWTPELQILWILILLSLYIGTFILDNLDLLRIGLDVAANTFFEKGGGDNYDKKFGTTINLLKEGHRIEFANALIGRAILELGKEKNDAQLGKLGEWILNSSDSTQYQIDQAIVKTLKPYGEKNKKVRRNLKDLAEGQTQNIADNLIADSLERIKDL